MKFKKNIIMGQWPLDQTQRRSGFDMPAAEPERPARGSERPVKRYENLGGQTTGEKGSQMV